MPSATRNTNANSGTAGSAPGKLNTWLKTNADTPRAAPKDSTVATVSSSAATSDRSSRMRTSSTAPRITGMINRRSLANVSTVSIWMAVLPPTRIWSPYSGMACSASRTARTAFSASSLSDWADRVAWIWTSPLTTSGRAPADCGPAPAAVSTAGWPEMPSTPATVSTTCWADASGAMITTGFPEPPGKCWFRASCPAMESTSVRKTSVCEVPDAFRVGTSRHSASLLRASRRSTSTTAATAGCRNDSGPCHQPVTEALLQFLRQDADQVRMLVGHEARQQAEAGAGAGGLHVDKHIGGTESGRHRRKQPARRVQVVHLQHRVDEIHQRMVHRR